MEWINVEDKLPERELLCITYFPKLMNGKHMLDVHYEVGFGLAVFGYRKPTKWMPIKEPLDA